MRRIRSEADFDELLRGARALAVVAAWNDQGLFDALADGPKDIDKLAADRRALDVTIPVLKHLGLLYGDGNRVGLAPTARALRDAGKLPTRRNFALLGELARIGEVLERGGPLGEASDGGVHVDDPVRTANFLDMLYEGSADSARLVHDALSPLLPEAARVLDVGGGHGRYARAFADAGHAVTLFDFQNVVDYSRARHGDALRYVGGNFRDESVDFGGPYDLVFLSNIVHGEPDTENRSLMRRLAASLAPGGHIAIKDMFLDEQGQDPENAVFFGLTMLLHTRAGQSPSLAQAYDWFEHAGLTDSGLSVFDAFQIVRARRA